MKDSAENCYLFNDCNDCNCNDNLIHEGSCNLNVDYDFNKYSSKKMVYQITYKETSKPDSVQLYVTSTKIPVCNLLLDTGADISTIKVDKLKNHVLVDTNVKSHLKGISDDILITLGLCYLEFDCKNFIFKHPFQVFKKMFPLINDGILGRDFLEKYGAKICYQTKTLTLTINDQNLIFKLIPSIDITTIPPRSEMIVRTRTSVKSEAICYSENLDKDIWVNNTIVRPINGYCFINIINSTDQEFEFDHSRLKFETLITTKF